MSTLPHLRTQSAPALLASRTDPHVLMEPGKPLALLTYLALSGTTPTRDHVVDLLWAHVPVERGRQSLRQALWQIRLRLGQDAIVETEGRLSLPHPPSSDVADFLRAVAERPSGKAAGLYYGPFFQTFAAPGAIEFEQWADTMRARLFAAYCRSAEEAVGLALDAGRADEAIDLAVRLRDADPDRQEGWRTLIETLRVVGAIPRALLEGEALAARVAQQGEPLDAATVRLLEDLKRPRNATPEGEPLSDWDAPELVGRELQFAALHSSWIAAARGRPQFTHIVGEPGLGKTRLLKELQARLRAGGASIACIAARSEERETPYSLAADLANALGDLPGARGVSPQSGAVLVALDPRLASRYTAPPDPSVGEERERRRLLALGDLITAVAQEHPTAIFIDDLHWADPTSARVINGALRRVAGAVLIVTTSRLVRSGMTRDERASVVGLDPLQPSAITALLMAFGEFEKEEEGVEVANRLHAVSGGSPLRALEALREATSSGSLDRRGTTFRITDLAKLRESWERMRDPVERLRRLDVSGRTVLLALAVWARPTTVADLELLTGEPRERVAETLRSLERSGFASEHRGEWSPFHHTVTELVQQVATEEELRDTHRRAGHARLAGATDLRSRRDAIRHLWLGEERALVRETVAIWILERRREGDRRHPTAVLEELCPSDLPIGEQRTILGGLPWSVRHPTPTWVPPAVLASAALIVLLITRWCAAQPERIVPIVLPLVPERGTPALVVELHDRLGRRVRSARGTVTVRGAKGTHLVGDSIATLVEGSATFTDLSLEPPFVGEGRGVVSAELVHDGQPLGLVTIPAPRPGDILHLRWDEVEVNGKRYDGVQDTVVLRAGEGLSINLAFRYNALFTSSVRLVAIMGWQYDRRVGWLPVASLPAPKVDGIVRARFYLPPPSHSGNTFILFASGPATEGSRFASLTPWYGPPHRWNDGRDLADITESEKRYVQEHGYLDLPMANEDGEAGTSHREFYRAYGPAGNRFYGAALLTIRIEN